MATQRVVKRGICSVSPEQFLHKLRECLSGVERLSVSINDDTPCPRFEIKSSLNNTAPINGYYCESGDSFIQVASSGREEFTGDEVSALRFLERILDIVNVLTNQGCAEKQWSTFDGRPVRSVVDLHLAQDRKTYRLGKPPHFWQRGLEEHVRQFAPFQNVGV
jgi:hypothetical protein